ncbi:hypothetical protein L6270_00045 [Candidatus Parcubacteria bacterium]|nr:hypothetical protein [Patescibacteria group bacterium]MBU4309545.1 hypothetical protein [Patescibacteria group bacterium]MBU4432171.1 hypothetical protein [Patescibacteria group bacterium]MBU4578067.1 hypothetical protein [Patescibacteria group bacterium]MCG2696425.1 hypothetical protein [Candidatus Parcubacteria bacterium]
MLRKFNLFILVVAILGLSGCSPQFSNAQCCRITTKNGVNYSGHGETKTKALHSALRKCGFSCNEEYLLLFE